MEIYDNNTKYFLRIIYYIGSLYVGEFVIQGSF